MSEKLCTLRKHGGGSEEIIFPSTLIYSQSGNNARYTFQSNYDYVMVLSSFSANASSYHNTLTGSGTLDIELNNTRAKITTYKNVKAGDVLGMPWTTSTGITQVYV